MKPLCIFVLLEKLHIVHRAFLCLSPQGHNIFSNLSSTEYSDLMQLLKLSILATDLTLYFEYVFLQTATIHNELAHFHREQLSLPIKELTGFF